MKVINSHSKVLSYFSLYQKIIIRKSLVNKCNKEILNTSGEVLDHNVLPLLNQAINSDIDNKFKIQHF